MQDRPNVPSQVTLLLERVCAGEQPALDDLMPLVYAELRRIARSLLSQGLIGARRWQVAGRRRRA